MTASSSSRRCATAAERAMPRRPSPASPRHAPPPPPGLAARTQPPPRRSRVAGTARRELREVDLADAEVATRVEHAAVGEAAGGCQERPRLALAAAAESDHLGRHLA